MSHNAFLKTWILYSIRHCAEKMNYIFVCSCSNKHMRWNISHGVIINSNGFILLLFYFYFGAIIKTSVKSWYYY